MPKVIWSIACVSSVTLFWYLNCFANVSRVFNIQLQRDRRQQFVIYFYSFSLLLLLLLLLEICHAEHGIKKNCIPNELKRSWDIQWNLWPRLIQSSSDAFLWLWLNQLLAFDSEALMCANSGNCIKKNQIWKCWSVWFKHWSHIVYVR